MTTETLAEFYNRTHPFPESQAEDVSGAILLAHWNREHQDADAIAARAEECRALGIDLERASVADDPTRPGGLVVSDNCAICGAAVEVHMPPSVCPDCQAGRDV